MAYFWGAVCVYGAPSRTANPTAFYQEAICGGAVPGLGWELQLAARIMSFSVAAQQGLQGFSELPGDRDHPWGQASGLQFSVALITAPVKM